MIAAKLLLCGLLTAATFPAAMAEDPLEMTSRLLRRQEPGSPAYNCHDTCGQALRQGRFSGGSRCSNAVFTTNYDNCLKCSGPENTNIWTIYGNSLGSFGRDCGLSTAPVAGKQDPVPPAIPAVDPAGSASSVPIAAPPRPTSATAAPSGNIGPTTTSPRGNSSNIPPSSSPLPAGAPNFIPNIAMAAVVYAAVFAAAHMF